MRQRCSNPNNKHYSDYGGRGIKVCDRWQRSFAAFFEDMGPRPSPDHRIEREYNNGNYEPGNCYWATHIEQANNRRDTIRYQFKGEKLTARELLAHATNGISMRTLRARLEDLGWDAERAITSAVVSRSNRATSTTSPAIRTSS